MTTKSKGNASSIEHQKGFNIADNIWQTDIDTASRDELLRFLF